MKQNEYFPITVLAFGVILLLVLGGLFFAFSFHELEKRVVVLEQSP